MTLGQTGFHVGACAASPRAPVLAHVWYSHDVFLDLFFELGDLRWIRQSATRAQAHTFFKNLNRFKGLPNNPMETKPTSVIFFVLFYGIKLAPQLSWAHRAEHLPLPGQFFIHAHLVMTKRWREHFLQEELLSPNDRIRGQGVIRVLTCMACLLGVAFTIGCATLTNPERQTLVFRLRTAAYGVGLLSCFAQFVVFRFEISFADQALAFVAF